MPVNTTRYDRYGRPAGYINPIEGAPEPYKIKQASATTTYTCFYETGSDPRAIRRDVQLEDEAQACVGWGLRRLGRLGQCGEHRLLPHQLRLHREQRDEGPGQRRPV